MSEDKKLRIVLVRGLAGKDKKQIKIANALGLRRTMHEVIHKDTPEIRGMISKIPHLLKVTEE